MTEALPIIVTSLAAKHIREANEWWRLNRTAAPNAVRREVQQAFALIARSLALTQPDRVEIVALWHRRRGSRPPI